LGKALVGAVLALAFLLAEVAAFAEPVHALLCAHSHAQEADDDHDDDALDCAAKLLRAGHCDVTPVEIPPLVVPQNFLETVSPVVVAFSATVDCLCSGRAPPHAA
jgi:hypothetical protein